MRSGCGKLIIPIGENWDSEGIYEIPTSYTIGSGGCRAMLDAVNALVSLSLRWGVPIWDIQRNLCAIKCDIANEKFKRGEADGRSCADCIGRAIKMACPDDIEEVAYPFKKRKDTPKKQTSTCPKCGAELEFGEGCNKGVCKTCGWGGSS